MSLFWLKTKPYSDPRRWTIISLSDCSYLRSAAILLDFSCAFKVWYLFFYVKQFLYIKSMFYKLSFTFNRVIWNMTNSFPSSDIRIGFKICMSHVYFWGQIFISYFYQSHTSPRKLYQSMCHWFSLLKKS